MGRESSGKSVVSADELKKACTGRVKVQSHEKVSCFTRSGEP